MSDLRGAIFGYGLAGRVFHGPLIDATPGLRVAVVVTSDPERARLAREAHPDAEVVAGAAEALARAGDLDFAVVANANEAHVPTAMRALEAGIPVVVEKPLAATADEAREVVAEAERRGVPLTVFLNRRWDSDQLTIARLLAEDRLGPVLRHESRFERWRPALSDDAVWRESHAPERGGGLLLDLGPHLVDQAIRLLGAPETVYAEIEHRRGGAADDDVFLALTHPGGVRSHIWCSVLAAAAGPRRRVLGERGTYVVADLDGQEAALKSGARPGSGSWGVEPEERWGVLTGESGGTPLEPERGDWPAFYASWAQALRGEGELPVDPRDAVAGLEILDAARRSARSREVVSLS